MPKKKKPAIEKNGDTGKLNSVETQDGAKANTLPHQPADRSAPPTTEPSQIHPKSQDRTSVNVTVIVASLALLFAIIAITLASLVWFNATGLRTQTLQQLSKIDSDQDAVQQQLNQTLEQNKQTFTTLHGQQESIRLLTQGLQEVKQQNHADEKQQVLMQVLHLLQFAHLTLTYNRSITEGTTLLDNANIQLAAINNPALLPLKQGVTNALLALKAIPETNIEALLSRLQALSLNLNNLPLVATLPGNLEQPNKTQNKSAHQSWRAMLENSWQALKSIIVIRYQPTPASPLLSPEQHSLVIKAMQFQLTTAEWATLHGNRKLYQQSLANVMQLLLQYFSNEAQSIKAFDDELKKLYLININPEIPDLTKLITETQNLLSNAQPGKTSGTTEDTEKNKSGIL